MRGIQFRWPWRSRDEIGSDVEEELRFHLDMRIEALLREGVPKEDARRMALMEFGDVEAARRALGRTDRATEGSRRRRERLADGWRDVRLGVRSLRRSPGFTAVAVLTLALGIGLATVVFTVVNGVLLRPLGYPDPGRLVTLWQLDTGKGEQEKPAPGNFIDWRDRNRSFEHLAAAIPNGYDLLGEGDPVGLSAFQITRGFLEALSVRPLVGRVFAEEEYLPGGPRVVLLSEGLWRERFGADSGMVGTSLNFDGAPHLVVGVLPATLDYPQRAQVYTPRGFTEADRALRAQTYYNVVGRLRPGITLDQSRDEMARIAAELRAEHPRVNARVMVQVVPLLEHITGPVKSGLQVLLGAVALVLLIACVNVANLLLARGLARKSELAVRAALGAGRGRIARQLLLESGVLAAIGGASGILLSFLALPAVIHAVTAAGLPRVDSIALDGGVLGAALLATIGTVLIAGLVPAWMLARDSSGLIARAGRGASQPPGTRRAGRMLVAAEVALALMLLVGAGLLGQSLRRLLSEDLGYATEGRLLLTAHFWDRYPEPAQRAAFMAQVVKGLEEVPGVIAAGAGSALPLSREGSEMDPPFEVEGRPTAPGEEPIARVTYVTPGYFDAMGIGLIRGRLFSQDDRADTSPVVVISETMARRIWPGEDPIGKRIIGRFRGPPVTREVVGVVRDVRHTGYEEALRPGYYIPHPQLPFGSMTIVIHSALDPSVILGPAQRVVWSLRNDLTFSGTETLEGLRAGTLAVRRVILVTLGLFAGLGAVLAAVGIYGVISLSVAQRTKELGVRMALGAAPASLRGLVLRQGLRLTGIGILLGAVGALGVTRLLGGLLYGTAPTDPLAFMLAAGVLAVVATLAAWIPARRATGVSPLAALRSE
jgi:putative ABC transport system permease protein